MSRRFIYIPAISASVTYATWDPANKGTSVTLSSGNLHASLTSTIAWNAVISTIGKSSGKWYAEMTTTNGAGGVWFDFGVADSSVNINSYIGGDTHGWGYLGGDGKYWHNGVSAAFGATYVTGDIIMIALDMTNGFVYLGKNGTWQNSGNPTSGVTGTGAMVGSLSGTIYMAGSSASFDVMQFTANFGATAFTYTVPSGYSSGLF